MIGDHKVKCYAWVSTFIYLSQGTKVKIAKLHKNEKKSKTIEVQWYCKEKCLHGSLHFKRKWLSINKMNNLSFFIESVYLLLYFTASPSFFKDIFMLGNLNCQSVPCIDHACWILVGVHVYSIYSSVRYQSRRWIVWCSDVSPRMAQQQVGEPASRVRPFTAFPSWSHWTLTKLKFSGWSHMAWAA